LGTLIEILTCAEDTPGVTRVKKKRITMEGFCGTLLKYAGWQSGPPWNVGGIVRSGEENKE